MVRTLWMAQLSGIFQMQSFCCLVGVNLSHDAHVVSYFRIDAWTGTFGPCTGFDPFSSQQRPNNFNSLIDAVREFYAPASYFSHPSVFRCATFVAHLPFMKSAWLVTPSRTVTSHLLLGSTFHSNSLWASCHPTFPHLATHHLERLSVWPPSVTSDVWVSNSDTEQMFRSLCVSH